MWPVLSCQRSDTILSRFGEGLVVLLGFACHIAIRGPGDERRTVWGSNGLAGSVVLLGVGLGCLALAGAGIFRVARGFQAADRDIKAWCVISMICAGLASLVGLLFALLGGVAFQGTLRYS
jgi:hypothetical protein